jgi:tetratricopeptide (TPR) repeat protein
MGVLGAALLLSAAPAAGDAETLSIVRAEEPYIGCEVLLTLVGKAAKTQGVTFEWSFAGNIKPILLRKGGLECRFTPFDTEPVFASVSALGSDGRFMASADISFAAKEFTINIVMVEPEPFMLWDINAKREAPADGLVAGEPVQFVVELVPPYDRPIACRWSTDASTAMLSGTNDQKVTIVRSEIGDAELSLEVKDANGLVLGRGRRDVHVPIPRAKVDESIRRKNAWSQWLEALALWDAKNFDSAVENAAAAADLDPETLEITDGLKIMRENFVRVERSRKLSAEAFALHKKQDLTNALKTYRRAYAAWAFTETEDEIEKLEAEIDAIRVRRQQAEWLKDKGAAYDVEGRFEDALRYYRETVALVPDDSVSQRAERIEKRLASIAQAKVLAEEGQKLEESGQLLGAVAKYKESLALEKSAELNDHTEELEATLKMRRARAADLRREAAELQRKKNDAEALVRYRESQALWPDPELANRIANMEKTVTVSSQRAVRSAEDFGIGTQADAIRLLQEGHALYKQGKYEEALEMYRKSHAISNDDHLAEWIERVSSSLTEYEAVLQANVLVKEANNLYREGDYAKALAKYKESLAIHPNAEVENFTKTIENNIKSADNTSRKP